MSKQTLTRRALLKSALATPLVAGLWGSRASDAESAALATGDPLLDLVIVDANVITMDDARPRAEAVAIKNGRFIAVGASSDLRALARPGVQTLSLSGKTVLPGLIDAHTHVASSGRQTSLSLNLGLSSLAAIKQAIKGFCQKSPQQRVDATVMSLGVLVYAAAKEVRRIRVRAV